MFVKDKAIFYIACSSVYASSSPEVLYTSSLHFSIISIAQMAKHAVASGLSRRYSRQGTASCCLLWTRISVSLRMLSTQTLLLISKRFSALTRKHARQEMLYKSLTTCSNTCLPLPSTPYDKLPFFCSSVIYISNDFAKTSFFC